MPMRLGNFGSVTSKKAKRSGKESARKMFFTFLVG
jgi:hypothetical protein